MSLGFCAVFSLFGEHVIAYTDTELTFNVDYPELDMKCGASPILLLCDMSR